MSIKERLVGMVILVFCTLFTFSIISGVSKTGISKENKPQQAAIQTPQPTTKPDSEFITTSAPTQRPTTTTSQSPNPQLIKVSQVIDGDTIQVVINGKKETIRLIGIDTPETVDPRKPVQCFGKEASAKAKSLLSGNFIRLEADPTQGERDKYQRILRYVFLEDGTNFNKLMIYEGYAHEYTYNTLYKYQSEFKQAQKDAEINKRGLWADNACSGDTSQSYTNTGSSGSTGALSGSSSGSGGFTCAGKTTCGQMASCAEAQFYLNSCGVSRLDGDKDGVPCESLCN